MRWCVVAASTICWRGMYQPCSWIHPSHPLPLWKRCWGKTNVEEKINQPPAPPKMLALKHHIHEHVQCSMHVKQQPCHRIRSPTTTAGPKKIQKNGGTEGLKQQTRIDDRSICHVVHGISINHSSGEAWQRSGGWCRAWPSCPWEICSASPSASPGLQPSSYLLDSYQKKNVACGDQTMVWLLRCVV